MPPRAPYRAWTSSSTSSRAPGSRPPIGIRPFLPVLLAGALASADIGHRLRRDGLRLPRGVAVPARGARRSVMLLDFVGRRAGRDAADRPPLLYVLLAVALALGALLAAGSVADRSTSGGRARSSASLCAALGFQAARSLFGRVRRRLDDAGGRRAARLRGGRRARWPRASRSCSRRSRSLVIGGARLAAGGRPPPGGREVRRPADPPLAPWPGRKKLVLAVIDAMKPAMLERAVAAGRAPALAATDGARPPRARLRRRLPLGHAGLLGLDRHRHRARPAPDPVDELVPPRGGALRRVRHELQASQAFGFKRSLTDTIYNMNGEHLSRRDADGVRVARRRRRAHGRHDVPDVPRPPPSTSRRTETALTRIASTVFREPVHGPREFFYADLFASRRTGCRSQLGLPGRARPARGLRRRVPGRARPVRLPALLAARQRHALAQARARRAGRPRWPPPTSRSSG